MALSAGHTLGPYEILAPIGAGGMGEVYKARDTRVDRIVAIKVSAKEFGERFQREAQAIASLNHPHICTLHDVGPDYLVMEYIEGTEIKGPLPIAEVLRLAIQIAEAVNHAHRHGVIHRDLKPGNILVTKSGVKMLDFGLAKLSRAAAASSTQESLAATLTQYAVTQQGTILGTPRYMSPEQLEGQEADQRSDIFAFGLVLYEMITGRPAFEGKTYASLIASILAAEPRAVTSFQPLVPPALVHVISTCLAKDPDNRHQNMHDVLLELRWIAEGGSQAGIPKPLAGHHKRREGLAWAVAAITSVAALALGFLHFRETPAAVYPIRFEQPVPPKTTFGILDVPAVSPDGRSFAYTGVRSGARPVLWLRRLAALQATALPGTEGAVLPFWSPDGRYIAYFANGKLRKIDANGGPPQVLCDVVVNAGGTWNRDGLIILGGAINNPLQQVPSTGGELKPLLKLDAARKENRQAWPHFLPDGRQFLYASFSIEPGKSGTYLGSIDGGEPRRLLDVVSNASFVSPGLLLFGRGPVLMSQPFDPEKLQLRGEPSPVADLVGRAAVSQDSIYSSSPNGTLVYRPEVSSAANLQPAWYDRNGNRLGSVGEPRVYRQGTLSPDEKRFAVQIFDPKVGIADLWLLDLTSGILSRITSDPVNKDTPVWSPDGREILFGSSKTGVYNLYRKVVGGGDEQLVQGSTGAIYPGEWLKDGSIVFMNANGRTFYRLPSGADAKPETLLTTEYFKDEPRISPDGRWVSYNTNESGGWEVNVAAFPSFRDRRQVSSNGGVQGNWRKDGKELFYLSLDGNLMSVPIQPGPVLEAGIPKVLFSTRIPIQPNSDQFAVTGDGKRFLMLESIESEAKPFTIVVNWPAGVKR